ncbi:Homocysteine S-methyltransferase 1 [Globomyces sp. JEL0801]|nr:Homocysteine S-methyltransferase 1 [Globomyces sp. JEL0801]
MGLGRYVNPMVPIWYKSVVDSLSDVPNGTFKIWVDQMGLKTIPYGDILVFVTFRLLSGSSGLLNTIQSALWYTTKQVSLQMFDHLHRLIQGANALENEMEAKAVDSLINFETVKYYSAEVFESIQYEKAIDEYQVADFLSTATMWILDLFQNLISQIGLLIGSLLCAKRICYDQTMTVGDFVFFLSYLTQLYGPLNYFGNFVDMEKLLDLFDMEIEVKDLPDAMDIVVADTSIRFENVNFSYDPRKKILNDISFTVPHGETVALVGQSGSGKSTIMKLLFRFYDVESGEITIGGKNISTVTQMSIRQMIGVVPQDTVLFNADISYNIRYGRPSATDEELRKASKAAQLNTGYETKVGERGLRLSGGEKQRVAIARTLLKDPKILALDEATSALDSNSETAVQEAFLRQGRTCLVIAHRLSTIKTAHKILVMREGRIVERGNHDILMALKGEYYQMWTKQSKEANPQLI